MATVKAPVDEVKRFVAYHLTLGADEIHIFLDDPKDIAFDLLSPLDRVFVTRCDGAYWRGKRPSAHQSRQIFNANRIYMRTSLDWLAHIDHDEYLWSAGSVHEVLEKVPDDMPYVSAPSSEPFSLPNEAEPRLFRDALPETPEGQALGTKAFGDDADWLNNGLLGHKAGKCLVRTGRSDTVLQIHEPLIGGRQSRVDAASDDLRVLHMLAYDEHDWIDQVERRLKTGSYRQRPIHVRRNRQDALRQHLLNVEESSGTEGLRAVWRSVQQYSRSKRTLLMAGIAFEARLWLDAKVAHWFPPPLIQPQVDSAAGELRGVVHQGDVPVCVAPDAGDVDRRLATFGIYDADLNAFVATRLAGRQIHLASLCTGSSAISVLISSQAAPESVLSVFEEDPAALERLDRTRALNPLLDIEVAPFTAESVGDALRTRRGSTPLRCAYLGWRSTVDKRLHQDLSTLLLDWFPDVIFCAAVDRNAVSRSEEYATAHGLTRHTFANIIMFERIDREPLMDDAAFASWKRLWEQSRGKRSFRRNLRNLAQPRELEYLGCSFLLFPRDNYTEFTLWLRETAPEHDEMQALIERLGAQNPVIIDVGANAGVFSLPILQAGGAKAVCYAIEPNPIMLERLRRNVTRSGLSAKVHVEECAISDENGTAHLTFTVGANFGQARLGEDPDADGLDVKTLTLTDFVTSRQVPRIDLLKVDVEGLEDRVIVPYLAEAPRDMLPRYIYFETERPDAWAVDLLGAIKERGYVLDQQFKLNALFKLGDDDPTTD
ncbi:MAG: FkbM family methyltransferase [Pseudomonadota bacterium]